MVESMPAWKKPCCCESSGRNARPISTRPGSIFSSVAPRSAIAPWRAKLSRVRRSKSGSAGWNAATGSSGADRRDFGQREAVEVARVRSGVRAGVLDEDEVVLLQVAGEELLAHDHIDRVAGRAGHVPGNG